MFFGFVLIFLVRFCILIVTLIIFRYLLFLNQEEAVRSKQKAPIPSVGDEREEDLSPVPNIGQRSRRGAVSAETYSEEDATTYVKKVANFFFLFFYSL